MWLPAMTDEHGRPILGSQVEIEIRHIGWESIQAAHFDAARPFTMQFPGRRVVDVQVRPSLLDPEFAVPEPGERDYFTLPPFEMDPHDSFTLKVLLRPDPRSGGSGSTPLTVTGHISGGGFEPYSWRRRRFWLRAAAVVAAGLVVSVVIVLLVSRGSGPGTHLACDSGSVSFKGSTAFAPIVKEVADLYEQACPRAKIIVRAVGSGQGLDDLNHQKSGPTSGPPIVAMYDGQPPNASLRRGDVSRAVGVLIFDVVGNLHLPRPLFQKWHGMTASQIAQAFADPQEAAKLFSARRFVPVGRCTVSRTHSMVSGTRCTGSGTLSGTRQAFVQDVLGGNDTAEQNAGPCPAANKNSVCLEDTTMDLLAYVNRKWYSIGYAEADALPYFPNVGAIPINGYAPTQANALHGYYTFVATEHLYTKGAPAGLTKDFINFLTSSTVTAELRRGHSFIGCSDLGGSALRSRCSQR
jgi:hypothetical protein